MTKGKKKMIKVKYIETKNEIENMIRQHKTFNDYLIVK